MKSTNKKVSSLKSKAERLPSKILVLNAFIARSGICSRRKAVELIKRGLVTVNDAVVHEPGYRVASVDVVKVQGKTVGEEHKVYLLLNKPKDCITTVSDEKGRKTVMSLIANATTVRIFPVGRLDRNTTGLLLFTNDGLLAHALSHPSNQVKKIYHAILNKPISESDLEQVRCGVMLEDGKAEVDSIDYLDGYQDAVVVKLHSGKNRVIRRIFEQLGHEVIRLDRVGYAGLNKKGLLVGRWRLLTPQEVLRLRDSIV
jgi:23S rRNA pseudouridine2605 synthase